MSDKKDLTVMLNDSHKQLKDLLRTLTDTVPKLKAAGYDKEVETLLEDTANTLHGLIYSEELKLNQKGGGK